MKLKLKKKHNRSVQNLKKKQQEDMERLVKELDDPVGDEEKGQEKIVPKNSEDKRKLKFKKKPCWLPDLDTDVVSAEVTGEEILVWM